MNRIRKIFEQRILLDFSPLLPKKCTCLPTCSFYSLIENRNQIKTLQNVPVRNIRCFTMSQNNHFNLRNQVSVKPVLEKRFSENINNIVKNVVKKHSMDERYSENNFEREDGVVQREVTLDIMEKQKHVIDLFQDFIEQCDSLEVLDYYENVMKRLKWPDQYLLSDIPVDMPITDEQEKKKILEKTRYVFTGYEFPVVTHKYLSSKEMLTSLGLDTAELKFYPKVQLMTLAEVERAVEYLHDEGFQVIFSLYLINFIHQKLKSNDQSRDKSGDALNPGQKLAKINLVQLYFKLCKDLEKPDLDPRQLIDEMIKLDSRDYRRTNWLLYILTRVNQLKYIGATSADIWSNLDLLDRTSPVKTFNAKVQLFENLFNGAFPGPFPISMFKKNILFKDFRQNFGVGNEVDRICSLLDITNSDLLEILSYATKKQRNLKDPLHCMEGKLLLALNTGITRDDILDNFNNIVMLPVDTFCNTIMAIKQYGGISSISVVESIIKNQPDLTLAEELDSEEDWLSLPEPSSLSDNGIPAEVFRLLKNGRNSRLKKRMKIQQLIIKHLKLDTNQKNKLLNQKQNLDEVTPFDLKKNIRRLIEHGFSNEDIASCPLILTHSTKSLQQGIKNFKLMLNLEAQKLTSNKENKSQEINVMDKGEQENLRVRIQSNPQKRIHALQYFLEKESSLSASIKPGCDVLQPHIDL